MLDGLLGPPGAETVGHMRRLVMMYIEELAKLRSTPDIDVGGIVWTWLTVPGGNKGSVRRCLPYLSLGGDPVPTSR